VGAAYVSVRHGIADVVSVDLSGYRLFSTSRFFMSFNVSPKLTTPNAPPTQNLAHPQLPTLKAQISQLRSDLGKLQAQDATDPMVKAQLKNVQAQLKKKNQALANLEAPLVGAAPSLAKPTGADAGAAPRPPPAPRGMTKTSMAMAVPRPIGTLGDRLKGKLPNAATQNPANNPPAMGDDPYRPA
jgi:hypothetical protein